ncbi:MAG: DNA polymerase III subunit epsilon [Woeseiaceae bacterium]
MRQVVLDTETTGIDIRLGNRILEIGCVEVIDRKITGNRYRQFVNPERDSEEGALNVHGITTAFLSDKPLFADIADDFLNFIKGAELVIHNAPFDIGFIDHELSLIGYEAKYTKSICTVLDTLLLAKKMHPGQKNNLNALCKRYGIDNSARDLHGALLDAEILADTYLAMTGGQTTLSLGGSSGNSMDVGGLNSANKPRKVLSSVEQLKIIHPNDDENKAHQARLESINKISDGECVWLK